MTDLLFWGWGLEKSEVKAWVLGAEPSLEKKEDSLRSDVDMINGTCSTDVRTLSFQIMLLG